MCWMEFLHIGTFVVPEVAPYGYFCNLTLYIIKKESDRWLNVRWNKRKGEYYMILWFIELFIMLIVEFVTHGEHQVPHTLLDTLVRIIFAYTAAMFSLIFHNLNGSETVISVVKMYLASIRKDRAASQPKKGSTR